MSNKQFSNRYSIEYLHPESTGNRQRNNKRAIVIPLILTALIGAGFFLWKQGYLNQFLTGNLDNEIKTSNSIPKQKTPTPPPAAVVTIKETKQPDKKDLPIPAKISKVDYSNIPAQNIFLEKCSSCHGKNGEGNLKNAYPKLQGQHASYISLQLQKMRDGKIPNVNESMYKNIKGMDNATFNKIATYISQIATPKQKQSLVKTESKEEIKKLTNKLNALRNQLLIEKKRNLELSRQVKKNLEISQKFANLYQEAEKNVPESDQEFLKIIEKENQRLNNITKKDKPIEKNTPKPEPINQTSATNIVAKQSINSLPKQDQERISSDSIEFSTSNQIDKILMTMNKPNVTSTTTPSKRRLIVTTVESNYAKKAVGIQNKINQLVSEEDVPETKFTKALKVEENKRKNSVRSVVVRKGETLWSISKRAYGTGFKYPKILKANPQLKKGSNVRLYIGQVIRVPK